MAALTTNEGGGGILVLFLSFLEMARFMDRAKRIIICMQKSLVTGVVDRWNRAEIR